MEETIDPMDRLSELPPFIIHQIMSHLSSKEVARTSILSKAWNLLHSSYPILDFHDSYTYFVGKDLATKFPARFTLDQTIIFPQRIHKFIEFVDASLDRFCQLNFAMQKFRLLIRLLDVEAPSSLLLDKWIGLAIENNVKELDFTFHCRRDIEPRSYTLPQSAMLYTLPQSIFTAKSVTTLNIFGCKLVQLYESIRLHSLKSLTLKNVCINEECLQKLTTQCPLLEDLVLSHCLGFRHIYIFNACKLKIINICQLPKDLESIKIVVPSLQQFILDCFSIREVPTVIDMAECPNLKLLKVSGVAFTDQGFHRLISKFPLLESLYVCHCYLLEQITISSNLLKNLDIDECPWLKAIDVDTPNLLSFSFDNGPPTISSINAPCPWKVGFISEVCIGMKVDPDTQWYLNVKEFLGVSNQIEDLTFTVSGNTNSFNFDEFRKSSHSLPCEVGTLNLITYEQPSNYAAFLDGVFGICYARTLSAGMNCKTHFFEWLYKQLMNRDTTCCNSHDIKCWRHYLKDVKIGSFVPCNDEKPIRIDNPLEALPELPGGIFWFHLDWCFPIPIEKA